MFANLIGSISGWLYGYILIFLLIAAGIYFTIKTNFVQFRLMGESFRVIMEKRSSQEAASSFQAMMVSTASRVGTGNIIGVSTAVCLGGAGAVFWMWVIAILGGASAFIESTLAQIYKRKDGQGRFYGGPAYYIESVLKNKPLAIIFAISLILTYGAGFNMLASYNLQSTFEVYGFYQSNPTLSAIVIGAIVAGFVFYCLMGGGKRIIGVATLLVPVMGLLYIVIALLAILTHLSSLPAIFANIFSNAFDFSSIFGGLAGSCLVFGIKRGLYSNEAGVGSAPNAAAAADVSHPVKQGLVQMMSVFIDTLVLCTCTAFILLCSGVEANADMAGAPYVQAAFQSILGGAGPIFITLCMALFAFTTLIGNLFYVDNALIYLNGQRMPSASAFLIYRIIAVVLIFIGAIIKMGLAWDIADVLMGIMALINVPVIVLIGSRAIAALNDYIEQKKAGKNPVFQASSIGLTDTECWK